MPKFYKGKQMKDGGLDNRSYMVFMAPKRLVKAKKLC